MQKFGTLIFWILLHNKHCLLTHLAVPHFHTIALKITLCYTFLRPS